jgi:hypothetical protein
MTTAPSDRILSISYALWSVVLPNLSDGDDHIFDAFSPSDACELAEAFFPLACSIGHAVGTNVVEHKKNATQRAFDITELCAVQGRVSGLRLLRNIRTAVESSAPPLDLVHFWLHGTAMRTVEKSITKLPFDDDKVRANPVGNR